LLPKLKKLSAENRAVFAEIVKFYKKHIDEKYIAWWQKR
jgi:hypothetical protein